MAADAADGPDARRLVRAAGCDRADDGARRARSAIRITLESQLIGLALILLATARAWEDIDTSNALAYVFVAGIAALFVLLAALEWRMPPS